MKNLVLIMIFILGTISNLFAGDCGVIVCDDINTLEYIDKLLLENSEKEDALVKQKKEILYRSEDNVIVIGGNFRYTSDKICSFSFWNEKEKMKFMKKHYLRKKDGYWYENGVRSYWVNQKNYNKLPPKIKKLFEKW